VLAKLISLYQSFYLAKRTYIVAAAIILFFALSFFNEIIFLIAKFALALLALLIVLDAFLLYAKRKALLAGRICKERFSNGDENHVQLQFINNYTFKIFIRIIDELPYQFQERNWMKSISINSAEKKSLDYSLRPVQRGEYLFGKIQALVTSPLQLVERRFSFPAEETVMVYPSYLQMKKYSLHAIGNQLNEAGSKRLRKLGNSVEFEQIKEYVRGDDYRTVNWKATARKNQLMVNTYVDEKSQQVYCLIDKSRNMQMPFEGMSLLDYAINASLVITNVALHKQDKAGLVTFAEKMNTFLPAERNNVQMEAVLESLYKEQTNFLDADYEALYAHIRNKIKQRSLLVLFTNFESQYALERQLPYLKKIAHHHLLMVVIFENTEIKKMLHNNAVTTEDIYIQVIAEKFSYEKRLLVKELQKSGILTLLTSPEQLTVNALNKYLEIKSRQAI
jgi:uncharacterized protein (DUF58 family)